LDGDTRALASQVSDRLRAQLGAGAEALDAFLTHRSKLPEEHLRDPMALRFARVREDGRANRIWDVVPEWRLSVAPMRLEGLRDRGYFRDAQARRLWSFAPSGEGTRTFAAETVKSRVDGDVTVVVARPVRDKSKRVALVSMASAPLVAPARPPGIDFAFVDRECQVVLHSQVGRTLVENLCEETGSTELRAAVFARREHVTPLEYYGVSYDALVRPIAGSLWSLVVLRDRALVEATAADALLATLAALSPYLVLWTLVLVGIAAFRPGYRADWLWPDPHHWRPWWPAAIAVMGVGLAVTGLANVGGLIAALATYLVPLISVGAARYLLTRTPAHAGGHRTSLPPGWAVLVAALVAVNGALPALLAYRAVHDTTMIATQRRGQIQAVYAAASRRPLDEDRRLEHWRRTPYTLGFFQGLDAPVAGGQPDPGAATAAQLLFRRPSALVLSVMAWPSTGAAESGRLVYGAASDGAWRWPESDAVTRLVVSEDPLLTLAGGPHVAARHTLGPPGHPVAAAGLAVLVLGALAALAVLVGRTGMKLMSWQANSGGQTSVPHAGVVLQWDAGRSAGPTDPRIAVLDLRTIAVPGDCAGADVSLEVGLATTVVVTHLDARLVDSAWRPAVLPLLERLVFVRNKTVVLLTALDPVPYARQLTMEDEISADEANRWVELCAAAKCKLVPGQDDVEGAFETLGLERTIAEQARASALPPSAAERWPWLWARCTRAEKLALAQFADEGFFNPRAVPVVRRLLERGLIVRDGALRFADAGFREFVRSAEPARRIDAWEREGMQSPWQTIRMPVLAVLLAAGGFAFATQQEVANAALAAITAAAGALPIVLRFLATGSEGKGQPSS
jgi:hypothetical protein